MNLWPSSLTESVALSTGSECLGDLSFLGRFCRLVGASVHDKCRSDWASRSQTPIFFFWYGLRGIKPVRFQISYETSVLRTDQISHLSLRISFCQVEYRKRVSPAVCSSGRTWVHRNSTSIAWNISERRQAKIFEILSRKMERLVSLVSNVIRKLIGVNTKKKIKRKLDRWLKTFPEEFKLPVLHICITACVYVHLDVSITCTSRSLRYIVPCVSCCVCRLLDVTRHDLLPCVTRLRPLICHILHVPWVTCLYVSHQFCVC